MENDIFISYSRKDKDYVHKFVKELEKECLVKCWIDLNGIESGVQFGRKIQSAIDNTKIVLFMMSKSSMKSEWAEKEVRYAMNIGHPVVPVLLPGEALSGWFLFEFGNVNCISLDVVEQKSKLINDIKSWTEYDKKQAQARKTVVKTEEISLPETSASSVNEVITAKEINASATNQKPTPKSEEFITIKSEVEKMEKAKAFKKYRYGNRTNEGMVLLIIALLFFSTALITILVGLISGWVGHPILWIKSHMGFLCSMLVTNFILAIIGLFLVGSENNLPSNMKKHKDEFEILIRNEKLKKGDLVFYFARKSFGEYIWTLLIALLAFAVNYYFYFQHWPFMH